jgi:OOP family OmpA-OmpF porin
MRNADSAVSLVRFLSFLAFFGLIAVGPTALAANQGYVGASFGKADYDILDDDDSAIKVFGGVQLNPNVAVELSYVDLGKVTVSDPSVGSASVEATGLGVAIVGMHSSGNIGFFGKAGFFNFDTDANVSGPIAQEIFGVSSVTASDTGTELFFGVGLNFDLNPNFGLRAEWEHYDLDLFDDVDLISLGLVVKF